MDSLCARNIVIVGGGTAGWMTAAALAHKLRRVGIRITLVESAEIGTVGVGEATVPHIRHFNASLGIDEADFMAKTAATFKLGIDFRDWGRIGDAYIHPFGVFGETIGGVPFHQHWLRARRAGRAQDLQAYSVPVQAARRGRFAHPAGDGDALEASYGYAYQFDAGRYAAYLRAYAEARGVVRVEGQITSVDVRHDGHVTAAILADGRRVTGDLFVDCSGFRALLIGGALGSAWESWAHWLPCDRAIAIPCANAAPIRPFTTATARAAGWTWHIPLQHRAGNGHVYGSAFTDDDTAERLLLRVLESPPLASPNRLRFEAGRRPRQWIGNTVAIGLSAGFLEPLESTSIHLIQLGIGALLDLFPSTAWDPADAAEYDRVMALEYERVRDFLILHYRATTRDDSDFWRHCRTMTLPASLEEKMALFETRGVVARYRDGMFLEPSWLAVYLGQNIVPRADDPRCGAISIDEAANMMRDLERRVSAVAEAMPTHAEMLSAPSIPALATA